MTVKYQSSPEALRELALGGVVPERREILIGFTAECFKLGYTSGEIRPALVEYIRSKQWPWLELDARLGIVQVAQERVFGLEPPVVPVDLPVTSLGDVVPESLRWLWDRKIPFGKVTVVYGEAGIGKTCWALDLAARVSAGNRLPEGRIRLPGPPPVTGTVVLVNAEDHLAHTIQPRLVGGGANLQNVVSIAWPRAGAGAGAAGDSRAFDPGRDIPALRQRITELGDVRLVIIDPLEAYCGAGPKTQRMRSVLAALEQLAEDCDLAVVVISGRSTCQLPVKMVHRVDCAVADPESRWLVPVRNGFGQLSGPLTFGVTENGITWDEQSFGLREDQMVGCPVSVQRLYRRMEVADWLYFFLRKDTPHYVTDVLREAAREGYSASQVRRARLALKVASYKESGVHGQWIWENTERKIPVVVPPLSAADSPETAESPEVPPEPERHDDVSMRRESGTGEAHAVVAPDRDDSERPGATVEELRARIRAWDREYERVTGEKAIFD